MSKNAIILPLFGINTDRYSLLEEAVLRLSNQEGDKKIYLTHNSLPDTKHRMSENILKYVTYICAVGNPVLWQKEALYNLGAQKALEAGAQNLIFSDADIIPADNQWLKKMQRALKKCDWVQGGRTVVYLTRESTETILQSTSKNSVDQNFAKDPQYFELAVRSRVYFWLKRKRLNIVGRRLVGFPGGVWGVTRKAWERYKGWDLHNIVGGGDLLHFNRLTNHLEEDNHHSYGNLRAVLFNPVIKSYFDKDGPWDISFTNSVIYHLWHGGMETRKYETRYAVLVHPEYQALVGADCVPVFYPQNVVDIDRTIHLNDEQLLELNENSESYRLLFTQIADYFYYRKEANLETLNQYLEYRKASFRFALCPESGQLKIRELPRKEKPCHTPKMSLNNS